MGKNPLLHRLLSWGIGGSLLTLAACQPPNGTPPSGSTGSTADPGPLKLGTLLPITGDLAQYGSPMQDAASLLIDTVNADCGGVLGQPVQFITEDSQTDPARAAAAMTKLVEVDQVQGVIGAAASAVSSVAVDVAVRNQVVQISPASTSPTFTQRSLTGEFQGFWFRTAPSDALQGPALAQTARERNIETVAIISINNDYGNGWSEAFIPAFEARGGQITNQGQTIFYPPDGVSFDAEVTKAFQDSPDAILLIAYPETGSLVLKAAYEKGLLDKDTQILLTDGMKTDGIAQRVGQNQAGEFILAGAIGTAAKAGGVGLADFSDRYQRTFNRTPEVYDPNTWDAAALLVLAAQAANSTQGSDLKAFIPQVANAPGEEVQDICTGLSLLAQGQDINYQGASGNLELDDEGDVSGTYDVWEIDAQGRLNVVETIAVGE